MRPFDTSPEAYEVQLEGYRKMSPGRKLELVFEMSEMARSLMRSGIRMRHPEYSEDQIKRVMVRLMHGDEIARRMFPGEELVAP